MTDDALNIFEEHRAYLFSIAYRMLGAVAAFAHEQSLWIERLMRAKIARANRAAAVIERVFAVARPQSRPIVIR